MTKRTLNACEKENISVKEDRVLNKLMRRLRVKKFENGLTVKEMMVELDKIIKRGKK